MKTDRVRGYGRTPDGSSNRNFLVQVGAYHIASRGRTSSNTFHQLGELRVGTDFRQNIPILVLTYGDQTVRLCAEYLPVDSEGAASTLHDLLHRLQIFQLLANFPVANTKRYRRRDCHLKILLDCEVALSSPDITGAAFSANAM